MRLFITELSPGEVTKYDYHWSSVYPGGIQDRDEEKGFGQRVAWLFVLMTASHWSCWP